MVENFLRPRDATEALGMLEANPRARFIAGGTYLLTGQFARESMDLVTLETVLPKAIGVEQASQGKLLCIGAGATIRDLLDSSLVPGQLKKACLSMVDRNIRNRATVGGNIGADKSCASLVPLFIALGAAYRCAGGKDVEAQAWHLGMRAAGSAIHAAKASGLAQRPPRLVLQVLVPLEDGRLAAFDRYSRTGCDLSVLTCAVSLRKQAGNFDPASLRICLGGLGPNAERYPGLEKDIAGLMKDGNLPSREGVEQAARRRLSARSDARGGAEFKVLRSAVLVADSLHALEVLA